jgi:hypothetical protein
MVSVAATVILVIPLDYAASGVMETVQLFSVNVFPETHA